MQWDRFFEDVEDQLASEWEAERASLDAEAERLRLARLTMRGRLTRLVGDASASVSIDVDAGATVSGPIVTVGADWVGVSATGGGVVVVPFGAIVAIGMPLGDLLRTARGESEQHVATLAGRITFGFLLRDLVRRRTSTTLGLRGGKGLVGTIDRAGEDHLDLALHDAGQPRSAQSVSGYRLVPLSAVCTITLAGHLPR